jgi:hypothetical protein
MEKKNNLKNVKISDKHHQILKKFCDKNGLKMNKLVEKWINEFCKSKVDIYGED